MYQEGCLSVPGIFADVTRADTITVKYLDRNGREQQLEAGEVLATCIQHEMDHLVHRLSVAAQARDGPQEAGSSASTWRDRQSGPPSGWPCLRRARLCGAPRRRFLPARIHPASGVAMRIVFAGTPEFAVSSLRAAAHQGRGRLYPA